MILADPNNPRAAEFLVEVERRLPDGFRFPDDFVLVIGGDGFLLRTIARFGFDRVYLGLNAGHLGFLLNDVSRGWDVLVAELVAGAFTEHVFGLLEARYVDDDGEEHTAVAINDVYLERSTGQAARLALTVDGHVVVDGLVADGLIFATALGSTAYAFSAGGEPLHPALRVLQVTPICPHLPRMSPFALPADVRAVVEVRHHEWRPVRVVVDGRSLGNVVRLEVGLSDPASTGVRIAYFADHDFTAQLVRKVLLSGPAPA